MPVTTRFFFILHTELHNIHSFIIFFSLEHSNRYEETLTKIHYSDNVIDMNMNQNCFKDRLRERERNKLEICIQFA